MSNMSMSSKQSENKIEIKGAKTPFRCTLEDVTTMYIASLVFYRISGERAIIALPRAK